MSLIFEIHYLQYGLRHFLSLLFILNFINLYCTVPRGYYYCSYMLKYPRIFNLNFQLKKKKKMQKWLDHLENLKNVILEVIFF